MHDAAGSDDPPGLPARGTLLCFDFGLARIGVAQGELETGNASALKVIHAEANQDRFGAIAELLKEWQPVALVTGVPAALDGGDQAMSNRCRRFANQLRGRYSLPVFEYDERLTSVAAEQLLLEDGVTDWRERKNQLDAVAAQLILQDFLDRHRHATT